MFKNLIPWKKRHGQLTVHHDEPTRESEQTDQGLSVREEFDALMNRFFDDSWMGGRLMGNLPSLWDDKFFGRNWDLGWEDKGNEYVFHAELPGFEADDFDIKVSGHLLSVHAEHKEERKGKKNGNGYRYGSFTKTATLPHGADDTKIDARYHSGILEVRLPKTEAAKSKRIEVKSA